MQVRSSKSRKTQITSTPLKIPKILPRKPRGNQRAMRTWPMKRQSERCSCATLCCRRCATSSRSPKPLHMPCSVPRKSAESSLHSCAGEASPHRTPPPRRVSTAHSLFDTCGSGGTTGHVQARARQQASLDITSTPHPSTLAGKPRASTSVLQTTGKGPRIQGPWLSGSEPVCTRACCTGHPNLLLRTQAACRSVLMGLSSV